MIPREVLEHLAIDLREVFEVKNWNHGQFTVYKQDLYGEETIADAVELTREVFNDMNYQVVVTSDGILHYDEFYIIKIQFV